MHDRRRLPPLALLPTFAAAARRLSFTQAGDELALTQSAVSRQVQALEESLGVRLFERRTRALALTREGQELLLAVEDALDRLARTTHRLRSQPDVRTVTLTTTPGFASLWLIPRLVRFTDAHPGIDVRTSASNQLVDIERTGVDVAVRYCTDRDGRGGVRLFGGRVMAVCSPRLLGRRAPALARPEDLRRFTLLYLDDPHAAWFDWSLWLHALGLEGLEPARRLHFSHYDQLIHAAVNGQGIALGLDPLVRQFLREGRLVAPFPATRVKARAWHMLRSSAAHERPEVDAFVRWLLGEVKADGEQVRAGARAAELPRG